MTDLIPLILAGAIVVLLVVGAVLYWKMIHSPWDEWDEISRQSDDETNEKKD